MASQSPFGAPAWAHSHSDAVTEADLAALERELFDFGIDGGDGEGDDGEGSPAEDTHERREREMFSPVEDTPQRPTFTCPLPLCGFATHCPPRSVSFDPVSKLLRCSDTGQVAGNESCAFLKHAVEVHGGVMFQSVSAAFRSRKTFHCLFPSCRASPDGVDSPTTYRTRSNFVEHLFSGGHHEELHFYCSLCFDPVTRSSVFFKTFRLAKTHFKDKHGCVFAAKNGVPSAGRAAGTSVAVRSQGTVVAKIDGQGAAAVVTLKSEPGGSTSPRGKGKARNAISASPTTPPRPTTSAGGTSMPLKQEPASASCATPASTTTATTPPRITSIAPASDIMNPPVQVSTLTSQLRQLVVAGPGGFSDREKDELKELLRRAAEVVGAGVDSGGPGRE
ncbi:hypothetical protein M427DRAFT_63395 [Gonapodya prolifera JEL478]|uniref:Uncharacterized protein n=1 Tax=Gonapodya prolifera (strain JEL478) TaxID=1344416 RepID=A0A138ZZB8_GONPJ|nr:hypothetical protein M427DRAFT_63395 [Gonapodya prolifera JEL478]|eukprot:KXS09856.1 hypothetical protein M427DRAFT_63395 [Gonapodya prolifera JEL478]